MRWSCAFILSALLSAQTLGTVRGIVHDPQHRPLENATVTVGSKTVRSDSNGEFAITDVPEGAAELSVTAEGFATLQQQVRVERDRTPVLHLQLELAGVKSSVEVSGALSKLNTQTSTVGTTRDAARNRGDTGRGSDQQPGDDYRFHSGRDHGPRHASYARRPSSELVPGWHSDREHRDRGERCAADKSEERRGAGGGTRRIFR